MEIQILRVANDSNYDSSGKFVGTYVNDELNDKLNLLSLAEGASKSLLLRKMILDNLAPKDLMTEVAKRIYNLSQMKGQPWSNLSIKVFKEYVSHEMNVRGIGKKLINQIFKKFDKLVK